jgi:histidinol-phosphate aminotransferase
MLPFLRADLDQLQAYAPHTEVSPSAEDILPIDVIDTNENPYDLPTALKEKLVWTFQHSIASNRYPDGRMGPLKAAIATYVNESANLCVPVDRTHISLGNGSDELIRSILIATCLGNAGSILVANPTFSMYGILAQTLGIPVVTVGRNPDFGMDLEAAHTALTATKTPPIRVVFVVHPNSPTGNALTPAEITWLQNLPESILVVIDEAYFEFSQTTLVGELSSRPNWIVMRTFSKAFRLAAHRVGYAIAHPDVITALEKVRLPYNLPSFTQAAALTAIAHRHELLTVIPEILGERSRLYAALRQQPTLQVWDSAANFLYVQLQPSIAPDPDAKLAEICQVLESQGTRIRHTGGGLRITIGTPAENTRTLQRLQTVLNPAFFTP